MCMISVIIPTYNSENTIERCLDSLVSQSFQNFEICIVDGYSTDSTILKIQHYFSKFRRFRILIELDSGVYDAMNKGVDLSTGDWLYFLGSDDELFDKDVFADVVKNLKTAGLGIIYGNVFSKDDTSWSNAGQVYDGKFDFKKLITRNICHQAIFYKSSLFKKSGQYNLNYPVTADWDLNLRFFVKYKSLYIERIISMFSGGGLSTRTNDQVELHVQKIKQNALKLKALNLFYFYKYF